MQGVIRGIFLLVVIGGLFNCTRGETEQPEEEVLLAEVYNKQLYFSEIEDLIPSGISSQDSALRLNALVDKWVLESLLNREAEQKMPVNAKIDQLVRDYRASLVRHHYEKLVVELELDSTVNDTDIQRYYESYQEDFVLKRPVVRCRLIKIPKDAPETDKFLKWWKSDNPEEKALLYDYAAQYSPLYFLNDSTWHAPADLSAHFPKDAVSLSKLTTKGKFDIATDDYNYFVDVLESTRKGDYAPLTYVSDEIKRVILHERSIRLLEDKKRDLYKSESRKNNIKVYTK